MLVEKVIVMGMVLVINGHQVISSLLVASGCLLLVSCPSLIHVGLV